MNKYLFHILIIAFLSSCSHSPSTLSSGDLLFVVGGDSDFSKAIVDATAVDSLQFDHVAIVDIDSATSQAFVIEAAPRLGVVRRSLVQFIAENGADRVIAMRLDDAETAAKAVARAKTHIGEDYDWAFLPDNGKMYCSELVHVCFLDADGSHIFPAEPMNFLDSDGNMPQFWTELFDAQGSPVPQGIPGTNPTDLSRSPRLRPLKIDFANLLGR